MNDPARRHGTDQGSGARWRRGPLVAAAAILVAMSLWTGLRGFATDMRVAFRDAPRRAIPPEIEEQARLLKARLQRGESLIYFGNRKPPDIWYSRLWQRALYPTTVLIVERENRAVTLRGQEPPRMPSLEELRKSFSIPLAISAGNPPDDPGFVSHVALPRTPGYPYDLWLGELRP